MAPYKLLLFHCRLISVCNDRFFKHWKACVINQYLNLIEAELWLDHSNRLEISGEVKNFAHNTGKTEFYQVFLSSFYCKYLSILEIGHNYGFFKMFVNWNIYQKLSLNIRRFAVVESVTKTLQISLRHQWICDLFRNDSGNHIN